LWPTLILLALYAVIYVSFAVRLIGFPYELDQGEGYDAWSAWLIAQGKLPYTDNTTYPYYSSNYPPVWSALVAVPMQWTGPTLAAGRAVSTISALLAALLIGLAAARLARRELAGRWPTLAGLLAAGFFLASPYVFHTTALARVNSLALLFAVAALSLVATPTRFRVAMCGLALLAGLFTKPTVVDAAVACLAFLLVAQPGRRIATAVAGLAMLALVAWVFSATAANGAYWLNVFAANVNPFDLDELAKYIVNFCGIHAVLLYLAGSEAVAAIRSRAWSPWVIYLPLAAVMGLGVGKWGAGESYLLGVIAATSVLAAVRVVRGFAPHDVGDAGHAQLVTPETPANGTPRTYLARIRPALTLTLSQRERGLVMGATLVVQMLLLAHGAVSGVVPWLPDLGRQADFLGRTPTVEDRVNGDAIVALLQGGDGPVLSEAPSFVLAAGRPIVGNATQLRNLHEADLWDPTNLVADVRARRFDAIVLNAQLYPAPVLSAIGRSYYLAHVIRVGPASYQVFFPGGD